MAVELRNPSTARRLLEREIEPDLDRRGAEGSTEPAPPSAARADPAALSRLLPPSPRDPNAQRTLRGRVAEDDRREMPPARVLLEPAPPAPAPAAPRRNVGERSAGYVGEPAVEPAWLNQRESALKALRAEYEGARAAAQAAPGTGPGWVNDFQGGNPNRDRPASDTRPRVESPDGRTMVFNEDAFATHFKAQQSAQPGSALLALAQCYDADATTLLTTQPGLWTLATKDHAINAGPAPAGRAMGDATQLGTLDLYLADPQIARLIEAYGGPAAPAQGRVAQEQVRLYGQARFEQLGRLRQAMATVRNEFSTALAQAQQRGSGPGWVERQATRTVGGEEPWSPPAHTEVFTERTFDPDAFTAWYTAQQGLANQAFASFYGQSHTTYAWQSGGEGGDMTQVATVTFDNPNWTLQGIGDAMRHNTLRPLNVNDPPRLHDRNAVGFDVDAGWVTHPSNIKKSRDWFETVVQVAIVGLVSYATAGLAGPVFGSSVAGTMATAAVAGAAGSVANGVMNGNFAWKDVLKGALAGGLSAGLMNSLGPAVQGAGAAGTIALRTTVQGGIQALLGGKFSDGALAGLASGLADLAAANMESGIEAAVKGQTMTAAEAIAARGAARIVGSAIRALGNPNDPGYAFASSFVNSLMPAQDTPTPGVTATAPPALDDDGNVMPGVVDTNAPLAQQALQLAEQLERQGLPPDEAAAQAMRTIGRAGSAPVATVPTAPVEPTAPDADGSAPTQTIIITGQVPRDALGNAYSTDSAGQQIVRLANGGGMLALGTRAVPITGNSATPNMALLRALAAESMRAGATLLTMAGNTGIGGQRVQMDETTRFESRPGELQGRMFDRMPDGSWQAREGGYVGFPVEMGFRVLSDAELRNLNAPIITPGQPRPPQQTPPLPIAPVQPGTPAYEAAPPAVGTPGLEAVRPVTVDDLIMRSADSRALGNNLAAAGEPRPASGYQPHHIVPIDDPRAADLRVQLAAAGITELNGAINGVWLPSSESTRAPEHNETPHHETFRDSYFRYLDRMLTGLSDQGDIEARLTQIKDDLKNGRPTLPPKK